MPNAFGYQMPRGQGTPDPRMVGQMLMQPGQAQMSQQPQGPQMQPEMGPGTHHEYPAHTPEEQMRREGGKLMGGGGADAMSQAVGEALTRAGGGHRGNDNPYKNRGRHLQQLQQLGLSEVEAMLLGETL